MSDEVNTPGAPSAPTSDGDADADALLPGVPELFEGSELVRLSYDEWNGLCADLERWLATRFRPRE